LIAKGVGLIEKRYSPKTTNSIIKRKIIPNTFGSKEYVNKAKLSRNLVVICNNLFIKVKQKENKIK